MSRLVGGDYLLDLSSIELEESVDGSTKTNITNAEILEQLTNLKKFVKNPQMIKPVWVKLYNGETDELIVVRGSLAVVDTGEFEICVRLNGYKLVIYIEFTQVTLDDDTPIDDWFIDTNDAKYLFTSDAQNIGAISELPVFENIVDKNGNKRFIEGDIVLVDGLTGFTQTYGKWALSGSHLLIVVAFDIADATAFIGARICNINIPEWIYDKIYALYGGANAVVTNITASGYADDYSSQTATVYMTKPTGQPLSIYINAITTTKERHFRIAFDLLIDNETPEQAGE